MQPSGYAEPVAGWLDLKYATGTGNDPLWESDILRPVFRALFVDWQNGSLNFPDLGDTPSTDPNEVPGGIAPSAHIPPLITPTTPLAVPPTLAGLDLVADGDDTLTFHGTVIVSSARATRPVPRIPLTVVAESISRGQQRCRSIRRTIVLRGSAGSFVTDGFQVGQKDPCHRIPY